MIVFPNCKINLGLRVRALRTDGYHEIETIFYPVPFRDAAEIIVLSEAKRGGASGLDLSVTGIGIPGGISENLCYKAWQLIKTDFADLPPMKMHLHKAIPAGAGLGGGSSDGAFTLRLLNDVLDLKLTEPRLMEYALHLGSDCPFFILNKPCQATGRGELLEEISIDLSACSIVLIMPGIHIGTGWAFSHLQITDRGEPSFFKNICQQPVEGWKDQLFNDFEGPVFREYPVLKTIKQELYEAGAKYSSLTGTGSCIYGIFEGDAPERLTLYDRYPHYRTRAII